ncbi:MAG: sigma-54-dependent transcriptional regulator [Gammaproteobacteria bacterium]
MNFGHILVVDDEPDIRGLLKEILEDEGFNVSIAENGQAAREALRSRRPDLILLDIWMPDIDGVQLLKEWKENESFDSPVIMISGHGTVETAVEAIRIGAYDFIEKPLSIAKLLITVDRALETSVLKRENIDLKKQTEITTEQNFGTHPLLLNLKSQIERVANHDTSALISGPTGSGKDKFAHYLHNCSPRSSGAFISVNIGGLAVENPGVELFGSETEGKINFGYLERANGGTLFMQDIFDMDLNTQARLVSALENQSILRVGGHEPVKIDVRVIASTRHDLQQEIADGNFRDDLFYALNVIPLKVPALKEHAEDIPSLLDHYIDHFVSKESLPRREFSTSAKNRLRSYEWPGNVRELTNLVQRLLIMGNDDDIDVNEIEMALGIAESAPTVDLIPGFALPLRDAREQFERSYFEYQLKINAGNVTNVASHAGIERTHLYRKLRALDIDPKQIARQVKDQNN